jgi:methanogenic corrinoid protein MtbC1
MTPREDDNKDFDVIMASKSVIAERVVQRQYAQDPSLETRFGAAGRERCLEDVAFHLAYLNAAVRFDEPEIFYDYAAWLKSMLGARGVTVKHIENNFKLLAAVLNDELEKQADPFCELLHAATSRLPEFREPPSELDRSAPHSQEASEYFEQLRSGNMRQAIAVVERSAQAGLHITDIHRYIIAPAMREMGRLWQFNIATVAHEHFASRVTQIVLSLLEPHNQSSGRRNRTVLCFCPAGEPHETGLRIVADAFSADGWTVVDLGANMPANALRRELFRTGPDVVLLSISTPLNLESGKTAIKTIREAPHFAGAKIIVGGRFLTRFPKICGSIGADACVAEAQEAVQAANGWHSSKAVN